MQEDRERLLASALADFLDRRARQEPADPEDLCRLYPELRDDLGTLAEIDSVMEPVEGFPDRLSGHRIAGAIGAGGMGRVLLAIDEGLGRQVAIKTLSPRYSENPILRARFLREARAMARLNHPNIARIYNLGPPDEPPHFVMEYIEGAPLTQAASKLTFHQKADLMHKVALAVAFLHDQGVIHRDLKPGNILSGPDMEPKLLDFGLALQGGERLSRAGEIAGTPEYLSPEQARGESALDARTDVFSMGAILYELLTGTPPFLAQTMSDLLRQIREEDPALPRRRDPAVPLDLQNICLKAMEKDRARRYGSAREMADDLQRFLAGEAVMASPGVYSRLIADRIGEHLRDLEGWRREDIISDAEYDGVRKRYERLVEREDSWIMEARRLTLPQVSLYLGAWVLTVGAALLALFRYTALSGAPAVLVACAAAAPTAWIGIRTWKRARYRTAIAYLLAFCLLLPVALLVMLEECNLFAGLTRGLEKFELFSKVELSKRTTNAQLWWSLLLSLPVYYSLRRFTRASVFSLVLAAMAALFCFATLLRMGMLEWIENDPGRFYFHLLPCAALFLGAGFALERYRKSEDSRYFYPFAVAFTWTALSGVAAFHEPYANWLRSAAPWTRGQLEYLFIVNAGIYFALDLGCGLLASPQVRLVGKAFRFLIPGHVLTSLLLLGLSASERWQKSPADAGLRFEARIFEWLLPVAACAFVFGSIPKQMKNFFATGLLFLAIGAFRLQQDVFNDAALWPIALLIAGLLLMLGAANYAPLRVGLARLLKMAANRRVWTRMKT